MKTNTLLGIILIVGAFAYQGITYATRLLWGLGLTSSYEMSEFVHISLVMAIIVMLISVIQVRKGRPGDVIAPVVRYVAKV